MKNLWCKSLLFTLFSALLISVQPTSFSQYQLAQVQRVVLLNGAQPQQNLKLVLKCLQQTCPANFYYTIPDQYSSKLNKISFTKSQDSKDDYVFSVEKYKDSNGQSYDLYNVELPKSHFENDEVVVYGRIKYLNRYVNYPSSITLSEDQKFEYEDYRHIISPYSVRKSQTTYKFAKILSFAEDGEKKGLSSVAFDQLDIAPFEYQEKHIVHGVNNQPQVSFSEVERIIEVSHWGNIAIVDFYKVKNTGPQLKGEFSRIQFGSRNSFEAKNAFRGIQTKLPYEIWGLYYRDQVGNVSTSKAYRDHHLDEVRFALTPRFALLGGWKCNWQIGYNLPTKGFLNNNGNQFSLSNIPINYAFSKIPSEKFTTKIILPEGSTSPEFLIEGSSVKADNIDQGLSFGYLDFEGRPVYTIQNIKGNIGNKKLEVKYHYNLNNIFKKPLLIFGAIFSTLFLIIVCKRLNLDTFTDHAKKD